jgi:hypothetical protein
MVTWWQFDQSNVSIFVYLQILPITLRGNLWMDHFKLAAHLLCRRHIFMSWCVCGLSGALHVFQKSKCFYICCRTISQRALSKWCHSSPTCLVCCGHRRQIEMSARCDRRSTNQIHTQLMLFHDGSLQCPSLGPISGCAVIITVMSGAHHNTS